MIALGRVNLFAIYFVEDDGIKIENCRRGIEVKKSASEPIGSFAAPSDPSGLNFHPNPLQQLTTRCKCIFGHGGC